MHFLRTYQLLVSPSVVSYLIRDQFYNFKPREKAIEDSYPKKIEYTLYILALKEFNLEGFLNMVLWKPLKIIGKSLDFLNIKRIYFLFIPIYLMGFVTYKFKLHLPYQLTNILPELFALSDWYLFSNHFQNEEVRFSMDSNCNESFLDCFSYRI